jgi:uncharacterized membrane protein YcjF (UPF0283 family)
MEGKRSKKRKRAKRLKFQNEKDDSAAVEEIDERKEEEESAACAFAKRPKSQGLSKSSTFLEKVRILLSLLLRIHRKTLVLCQKNIFLIFNYYQYIYIYFMIVIDLNHFIVVIILNNWQMRARLSGGHFRMINEKLYTCT